MQYPPVESDATFITTRIKRTVYPPIPGCETTQMDPKCAIRENGTQTGYFFYANIEDFTVLIR